MVVLKILIKIANDAQEDLVRNLFYKNFLEIFQQIILLFEWNQLNQTLKQYNHKLLRLKYMDVLLLHVSLHKIV